MLTSTTTAGTEFTLDHLNTAGIIGSDYIEQHGGAFRFQMTYISKDGTESARSSILNVSVPPLPPKPDKQLPKSEPAVIRYAKMQADYPNPPSDSTAHSP